MDDCEAIKAQTKDEWNEALERVLREHAQVPIQPWPTSPEGVIAMVQDALPPGFEVAKVRMLDPTTGKLLVTVIPTDRPE